MRRAAALVVGLALAGCGRSQEAAVQDAARSFDQALRSGDGAAACAALAPSTRQQVESDSGRECAQALAEQHLVALDRVTGVERYGRQASIGVQDADGATDTWFLSRFDGRWLLVAASCAPRPELPYDCDVEGP